MARSFFARANAPRAGATALGSGLVATLLAVSPPSFADANEPHGPVTKAEDPLAAFASPELALKGAGKAPAKLSLALEDADLSELLRSIGQITGKKFIVPSPKIRSLKASLYAPGQVTVDEAYRAFLAVLQANGLTVVPKGEFLEVVEALDAGKHGPPLTTRASELPREERYVTHLHRLAFLSAEEVATTVLSKFQSKDASVVPYGSLLVITDTAPNVQRMLRILEEIDVGGAEDHLYVQPLFHQPAADVEKRLKELFDTKSASTTPLHVTKVLSVERPNALLVVATEPAYLRLLEVVKRLDVPPDDDTQVHVLSLQHVDAKKVVEPINAILQAGASPHGGSGPAAGGAAGSVRVSADEGSNALLVHCSRQDFVTVAELIHKLDQPKRQVYIEAVILDVTSSKGKDLSVAYHGGATLPGDALAAGGMNVPRSLGGLLASRPDDPSIQALALGVRGAAIPGISQLVGASVPEFGMFLSAIETSGDTDIVSAPHILASDNTPAEIRVQLNTALQNNAPALPALPAIPGVPGGAAGAPFFFPSSAGGYSAPFGKIGPRIKITPHVNDSDQVRLDVEETISDLTAEKPQGTLGTKSFVERSATTTLTVRDHETVVIGGLVRDRVSKEESKVPFLGDIPVLGALFRSRADVTEKSNLVLILTPHVIRDQADLRRIFERKMQERQQLMDHVALFQDRWERPLDVSHGRGLLATLRKAQRQVAEDDRLAREMQSRAPREHTPQPPLDMPASPRRSAPQEQPERSGKAERAEVSPRETRPITRVER